MGFSSEEKNALLKVKGVGPTITPLVEIGIHSLAELKKC